MREGQSFDVRGQLEPSGSSEGKPVGKWAAVEYADSNEREKTYYYESVEERFEGERPFEIPGTKVPGTQYISRQGASQTTFQTSGDQKTMTPSNGETAEFHSRSYKRTTTLPDEVNLISYSCYWRTFLQQ